MILFYRLLAWMSKFTLAPTAGLVLLGLLSMFLFLLLGLTGIFVTYDRSRSKH
jgi:hypothetical protein